MLEFNTYGNVFRLHAKKIFIKEIPGGVEMEEIIDYKIPFGKLGRMINPILIQPKLTEIFNYRKEKLENLFGKYK